MQPMIKKEAENVGPVVAYFSELSLKEKNHYYRMTHNKQTNNVFSFIFFLFLSDSQIGFLAYFLWLAYLS